MRICKYPDCDNNAIWGRGIYCSPSCCGKFATQQRGKNTNLREENTCLNSTCNNMTTNPMYCSRTCAAIVNNTLSVKRKRVSGIVDCLFCDTKLTISQTKFCSGPCEKSYKSYMNYCEFVEGYVDGSDKTGLLRSSVRTLLLENSNYTCECGWSTPNPTLGRPILTIDHIDGNWNNNYIWNLRVLCYNCHTLTPTFGTLNRGNKSGRRAYGFLNHR